MSRIHYVVYTEDAAKSYFACVAIDQAVAPVIAGSLGVQMIEPQHRKNAKVRICVYDILPQLNGMTSAFFLCAIATQPGFFDPMQDGNWFQKRYDEEMSRAGHTLFSHKNRRNEAAELLSVPEYGYSRGIPTLIDKIICREFIREEGAADRLREQAERLANPLFFRIWKDHTQITCGMFVKPATASADPLDRWNNPMDFPMFVGGGISDHGRALATIRMYRHLYDTPVDYYLCVILQDADDQPFVFLAKKEDVDNDTLITYSSEYIFTNTGYETGAYKTLYTFDQHNGRLGKSTKYTLTPTTFSDLHTPGWRTHVITTKTIEDEEIFPVETTRLPFRYTVPTDDQVARSTESLAQLFAENGLGDISPEDVIIKTHTFSGSRPIYPAKELMLHIGVHTGGDDPGISSDDALMHEAANLNGIGHRPTMELRRKRRHTSPVGAAKEMGIYKMAKDRGVSGLPDTEFLGDSMAGTSIVDTFHPGGDAVRLKDFAPHARSTIPVVKQSVNDLLKEMSAKGFRVRDPLENIWIHYPRGGAFVDNAGALEAV